MVLITPEREFLVIFLKKRIYLPNKRLKGFEFGKVGPKDGQDYIGGNYASAINLATTLPGLFRDLESNLDYQKSWMLSGTHYEKTSNAWLDKMDLNKQNIIELFKKNNSNAIAKRKFHFWRLFFIACAEIFGYDNGAEWVVSHHLFKKRD